MQKLTIIIPAYNVEKYIEESLLSCLEQDIEPEQYEIILVNDCSSDKTVEIAQKTINSYPKIHPNFRIINTDEKRNRGASYARNMGMLVANGTFLWFIDGDDKIQPNVLGKVLSLCEENELEVLHFGYHLWYGNNNTQDVRALQSVTTNGINIYLRQPRPVGIWSFVYKKSFLQAYSLRFLEEYMYEDEEFAVRVFCLCDKMMLWNQAVYYYRQRENSIMKCKISRFKIDSCLAVCKSLYDFRNSCGKLEQISICNRQIAFVFSQAISLNSKCSEAYPVEYLINHQYFPLVCTQAWKYRLINFSPRMYVLCLKIRTALSRLINYAL